MKNKKTIILIIVVAVLAVVVGVVFYLNSKSNSSSEISGSNINYNTSADTSNLSAKEVTSDYKITAGGEYTLTGEINTTVYIDTEDTVKLVLDGVNITSTNGSAIYVANAEVVHLI